MEYMEIEVVLARTRWRLKSCAITIDTRGTSRTTDKIRMCMFSSNAIRVEKQKAIIASLVWRFFSVVLSVLIANPLKVFAYKIKLKLTE